MLGTITNHNNMDINTLQKHMVPNGTSESTLGTRPKYNTLTTNKSHNKKVPNRQKNDTLETGPAQQFFDYFCRVIFVR